MYSYDRRTAFLNRRTIQRVHRLVVAVVDHANTFLAAVQSGEASDSRQLQKDAESLAPLAQWLIQRRESESEPVALFAKYTSDLAEMTKFWNRPAFLGRSDYAAKVAKVVERIRKAYQEVLQALRASQRMLAVR